MPNNISLNQASHLKSIWLNFLQLEKMPQLDKWLAQYFKTHKNFGKKDRRFYSDQMFAALRHCYQILCINAHAEGLAVERIVEKFSAPELILKECRKMDPEKYFHCLDQIQNCATKNFLDMFAKYSMPHYFGEALERRKVKTKWNDKQFSHFLENLNVRPPIWIRLNDVKAKDKIIAEFKSLNFTTHSHSEMPSTIAVQGNASLYSCPAYQNGFFEIQDLASQKLGIRVSTCLNVGDFVWDVCAGGGGKTIQLAAALNNRGAVYATDVRAHTLEKLKTRVKRTPFFNVRSFVHDATTPLVLPKAVKKRGGFDVILVDAPCSSSGTWRRNPEGKVRFSLASLERLNAIQLEILLHASEALKPGGFLIYGTCSWMVEEDEQVIEGFLKQKPQFKLLEQTLLGSPGDDSDTMFVAVMQN